MAGCWCAQDVTPEGWELGLGILLYVIGEALAVLFVVRILSRGGSSAATLNWVFLILAAPYLGLLLYYLMPRRLHLRRLKRRANRLSWIGPSLAEVVPHEDAAGPDADALSRLLCRLDADSVYGGNQLTLLETGSDFVTRAAACVHGAERFVHLETYILRPDRTGLRLLEVLTEVASRGVEVRVLYDSLGSWSLKRAHLQGLLAAGGKAEAYLPLLWRHRPFTLNLRNHRKLLVVDGETAFLGGRNIGDEYANDHFGESGRWLDTMVEVQGPAVPRLHRVFVEDWYNAAEEDLCSERYFPEAGARGDERLGIVASGPDRQTNNLPWILFQMISNAERTLDISSPYMIPDNVILTALQVSAARGVRVRVHTNGRGVAQFVLHRAQRSYYRALLAAGVEISESRDDYNHSKMILVDGKRFFVGSPNLDIRSERLNFEIAVVAFDAPICAAAQDMFERRLATAVAVREDHLEQHWWDPFTNGLCRLASPLL